MLAYQDFLTLSQSHDSEERGRAAHIAALAYLGHDGPADEHAALYAALIGFLDDPSVRVRGALAYGLLHAEAAPRPILLALLQDSSVIARAVVQYSPVLLDADLMSAIRTADAAMLAAIGMREHLSQRVATELLRVAERDLVLKLVERGDVALAEADLLRLAEVAGTDAELRGALLARDDLPAEARLGLVQAVASAVARLRLVAGAVQPRRLERLLRDATDTALTGIGEAEACAGGESFAGRLVERQLVSTRVMLHAIVQGHVLFFADCVAELADAPRAKVFALLERGSRAALNALLARAGLGEAVRNLIARLIFHARAADLADDLAARHFVVTALLDDLLAEHDGALPPELDEAFIYLSEQNVLLARSAARGVLPGFAGMTEARIALPAGEAEMLLALPAA